MTTKVLLIDDEESFLELIALWLQRAGHRVETARNGIEGLRRLLDWGPDLVILDLLMPGMDGWETCRRIRQLCDVPVIMLTGIGRGSAEELRGLKEGADLYMTKPLEIPVLLARVNALLRRSRAASAPPVQRPIIVGDLEIDLVEYRARKAGQLLELTPTEFRLLAALALRCEHVVPNQELIREVWEEDFEGDQEQYLRLYIHYLRRKIEIDPANPQYIRNRRGVGYFLGGPKRVFD